MASFVRPLPSLPIHTAQFPFSNGMVVMGVAALSGTAALLMPANEYVMRRISQLIVPCAILTILFVILPLLLLIAKLRTPRGVP